MELVIVKLATLFNDSHKAKKIGPNEELYKYPQRMKFAYHQFFSD